MGIMTDKFNELCKSNGLTPNIVSSISRKCYCTKEGNSYLSLVKEGFQPIYELTDDDTCIDVITEFNEFVKGLSND